MKYHCSAIDVLATYFPVLLFLPTPSHAAVCAQDNCYRAILATQKAVQASSFCSSLFQTPPAPTATLPALVQNCGAGTTAIARASSICSCFLPGATTTSRSGSTTSLSSRTSSSQSTGPTQCPPPTTSTSTVSVVLPCPSTCSKGTSTSSAVHPPCRPTTSCSSASTITSVSTTITTTTITTPSPSSCTELLTNNGFDDLEPAAFVPTRTFYPYISTPPVSMNGSALRASTASGGLNPAGIIQRVYPCPNAKYGIRAKFQMTGLGAERGSMYAIVDIWVQDRPGGAWQGGPFSGLARVDLEGIPGGTVYELSWLGGPGQDVWTASAKGYEGKTVLLEFNMRWIPDTGTAPTNPPRPHELWFDDAYFMLFEETLIQMERKAGKRKDCSQP
ncbi:hypothetical protein DL98DRAFT_594605 [Cadophora sp. DSE1049]|nr:hypothetical protein DL98DRAFT_594605 [Cadophora sp. DSE1049]